MNVCVYKIAPIIVQLKKEFWWGIASLKDFNSPVLKRCFMRSHTHKVADNVVVVPSCISLASYLALVYVCILVEIHVKVSALKERENTCMELMQNLLSVCNIIVY